MATTRSSRTAAVGAVAALVGVLLPGDAAAQTPPPTAYLRSRLAAIAAAGDERTRWGLTGRLAGSLPPDGVAATIALLESESDPALLSALALLLRQVASRASEDLALRAASVLRGEPVERRVAAAWVVGRVLADTLTRRRRDRDDPLRTAVERALEEDESPAVAAALGHGIACASSVAPASLHRALWTAARRLAPGQRQEVLEALGRSSGEEEELVQALEGGADPVVRDELAGAIAACWMQRGQLGVIEPDPGARVARNEARGRRILASTRDVRLRRRLIMWWANGHLGAPDLPRALRRLVADEPDPALRADVEGAADGLERGTLETATVDLQRALGVWN